MNNLETKNVNDFEMEDAIALAQQVDRYEQALKIMKDKLKAFVQLNGPVQANGKVYDFFSSSSWNFEPEKLKAMCGMMVIDGLNPFEYLSLSSTDMKRLKWSDQIFSQYGTKKEGSKSFRSVKVENYQKN